MIIYHMKTPHEYYIGQADRTATDDITRIVEHIKNGFLGKPEQEFEGLLRKYRVDQIEVKIFYPPDYGIDNFEEAYNDFRSQWVPSWSDDWDAAAGRVVVNNPKLRLQFAETFHILNYKGKQTLKNVSVGGQLISYSPRGLFEAEGEKYKVWFSADGVDEAKAKLRGNPNLHGQMKKVADMMYDIMFDSSDVENKLKGFVKDHDTMSGRLMDKLEDKVLTGKDAAERKNFISNPNKWFNGHLPIPLYVSFEEWVAALVKFILGKQIAEIALSDFKQIQMKGTDFSGYIHDFISGKRKAMKLILNIAYSRVEKVDIREKTVADLYNFKSLESYIKTSLFNLIKSIAQAKKVETKEQRAIKTFKFKPRDYDAVFDIPRFHSKEANMWAWGGIGGINYSAGVDIDKVNPNIMKKTSLQIFNRIVGQVDRIDYAALYDRMMGGKDFIKELKHNNNFKDEEGDIVVHAARFTRDLGNSQFSAKVHEAYNNMNLTGYNGVWYKFYRNMVSAWRNSKRYYDRYPLIWDDERMVTKERIKGHRNVYIGFQNSEMITNGSVDKLTIY